MTTKSTTALAVRAPRWSTLLLAGLLLAGVWALGATGAQAQVQIDQVESVASQIEGATQGQIVVTLPGDDCESSNASCEGVSRSDLTELLPGGTPALSGDGSGNRAVIVQRGNDNDATVAQTGTENEASVSQLGSTNEASVTQGAVSGYSGSLSSLPSVSPGLDGTGNRAVSVHQGSDNATTIRQYGAENTAGIRLSGSDNEIGLLQIGRGNEYLLDHQGSGLRLTGSDRIEQIGNQNMLVQEGVGAPIGVQMRGDGMRMIIRQNGGS